MSHVVFQQPRAQRHGGSCLQAGIERRVDLVTRRIDGVAVLVLHVATHHFRQVRGVDLDGSAMQARFHGTALCLVVGSLSDVAEIEHSAQYMSAAHLGRFGAGDRIDRRRSRRDPRQGGCFGQAQLIQALAEIHLGRCPHAVGPLAQENLVDVQGEYLLLGEFGLHEQRNVDFAHFAFHVAARGQKHIPRHLHGDGAGALADAAGFEIGHRRPQNSLPIDAVVPEKSIVFGRQEGLHQLLGQLLIADGDAPLLADRLDQLAVPGIDAQRHLELNLPQTRHIGQRGPQVNISTDIGEG